MKFVLFVEGHTETKALPEFLRRWLDVRLPRKVGIKVVRFEGWSDYCDEIAKKVELNLGGNAGADVIGGIGLLDLYGPKFYPDDKTATGECYEWAKDWLEKKVAHPNFRQHFAVHETEAWLLAEPKIRSFRSPPRPSPGAASTWTGAWRCSFSAAASRWP